MLRDCQCKDPSKTELFVVCSPVLHEDFREFRDPWNQAILEIDQSFDMGDDICDTLSNTAIQVLIAALGIGIDVSLGANKYPLDLSKTRYGKILIVAERDDAVTVDEVLHFFSVYLGPVVDAGYLYLLDPTLEDGELTEHALDPEHQSWRPVTHQTIHDRLSLP